MKLPAKAILLILLFASSAALAQPPFYKTYTLPAEAVMPVVNTLYQDKQGYILVGASTGLYRFDGIGFYKFSKDKNVPGDVTAICETKDGKTWIGFADGKLGWLKKNTLILQNPEEGLPKKTIKKILQDSAGVVWIATAGEGIYYYTNDHFYNINTDDGLSDNYVYDIEVTKTGIAAGTDQGLNQIQLSFDKKNITTFTSRNGLPDNILRVLYPNTSDINGQASGCLWIAMQDAGLAYYCPPAEIATLDYQKPWNYGQVNDILQVNQTIYLASENAGLIKFSIVDGHNTLNPEILIHQKLTSLLQDSEGNIWAAGNNQLIRTNGTKLRPVISLHATEATNLHALLIDKDNHVWFNVAKGLKHMEKGKDGKWIEKIFSLPVSINSQITALYEDKFENIWIGTMGSGAFFLDAKTGKFRKITESALLSSASVLSITGKNNEVWIASLEGAVHCQLNDKNGNIYEPLSMNDITSISGVGTNYIYKIFIDSKNRTWFATDGKGIAVYQDGKIINYTQKNGLKSEVVYEIAEDKQGNIWFTTFNAGLVRFDGKQFRHFTAADGLSDLSVTSMTADRNGNLYLTHKKGIDIVNTAANTITYLDDEQGLTDVNTDLNTITTCSAGDVYFVAGSSIYKYDPSLVKVQPKVVIDRIQLFLNDIETESGHVFSSSEDNISFYYTGLYYSQPQKIQYQYKLQGFGEEWITTNDRRKDFPRLAPGTYTFRVRASLNRNFENAPETSFSFTIQKPLWLRWWFIILFFSAIGLLLYWYIKGREQRINKMERLEKEKIQSQFETLRNQVNPHFLFNSFNTLISEIEDDPKRAVQYVEHMADFFRSIVTYREKDVIILSEEIGIIKDYLFIQQKRYGDAFRVNIAISKEEAEQYYLAPLTLQLLAENAIKHNAILKEKPLVLDIFVEADQLIVRNNINPKLHPERSAGLGLQNIRKRYELLTKKAVVVSNDDEFFTVIIPLIKKADGTDTDHRR
jgi:ligand-binding sensor domain-containing protein